MNRKQLPLLSDAVGKTLVAIVPGRDESVLLLAFDHDSFVVIRSNILYSDESEIETESVEFNRHYFPDGSLSRVFDAKTRDEWSKEDEANREAYRKRQEENERRELERLQKKFSG